MRDKANDGARIELMLESISNIEQFMSGITSYDSFVEDKLLCHAVIYNLQCIGESVYMLSKYFRETHSQMDWKAIEGMRHVLVHDYYQVNMETVWDILKLDIKPLRDYLKGLKECDSSISLVGPS